MSRKVVNPPLVATASDGTSSLLAWNPLSLCVFVVLGPDVAMWTASLLARVCTLGACHCVVVGDAFAAVAGLMRSH